MSSSLAEDYLGWLSPQIRADDGMSSANRTFSGLCAIMFEKEYVWLVPNDDNRLGDGLDLRVEFCNQQDISRRLVKGFLHKEHPDPPCSFLEVLIGLSRRLSFVAGGGAPGWAWQLITNLELRRMSDPITRPKARKVNDILDGCTWRNYQPNGQGGFFPLAWPEEDQTKVELWYQMAAFVDELPDL